MGCAVVLELSGDQKAATLERVKGIVHRNFDGQNPSIMSPLRTMAAGALPPSTPSSPPPSSTKSTRRLGSPTCSPGCRIIRQNASTNCCLGIGAATSPPLKLPERTSHPSPQTGCPCGLHRMRTLRGTLFPEQAATIGTPPPQSSAGAISPASNPTFATKSATNRTTSKNAASRASFCLFDSALCFLSPSKAPSFIDRTQADNANN
jgi:hypothetical protein